MCVCVNRKSRSLSAIKKPDTQPSPCSRSLPRTIQPELPALAHHDEEQPCAEQHAECWVKKTKREEKDEEQRYDAREKEENDEG